jgi:hypothetical protein
VRHTDARRLAQSGADEDDRPVRRKLREPPGDLVGREPNGTVESELLFLVATDVDQDRSLRNQLAGLVRLDPQRRAADR